MCMMKIMSIKLLVFYSYLKFTTFVLKFQITLSEFLFFCASSEMKKAFINFI